MGLELTVHPALCLLDQVVVQLAILATLAETEFQVLLLTCGKLALSSFQGMIQEQGRLRLTT
jgi:hypothetical protein